MANSVVSLVSIALLFLTTTQGKTNFHGIPSSVTDHDFHVDGICETAVETDDGYILSLQRLPAGRSGHKADKPPVLLQHGLFCDALSWLINPPDEALGFILADYGYDVWISNTRGTKYSRSHRSLSPNDAAFWNWSWDELASYDLPAFVKYVHNNTAQKIHYVGHSLGTLMAFTAFSRGQVLDRLRSAALLSPIAHMRQVNSPIARVFADTFLAEHLNFIGIHEFIPNGEMIPSVVAKTLDLVMSREGSTRLVEGICKILRIDCSKPLAYFTGPNCCLNSTLLNSLLDHGLQSTATKNLIHLGQMIRTGNIAKYDYGNFLKNTENYGQPLPPPYDFTAIPKEFPLFLSYGGLDMLSEVNGVNLLLNDLKSHDANKLVVLLRKEYAHVDFFMATNVKQVLYDPIISFFEDN
ncbi:Triacylglycerol lipase [Vigna angularis]|uniref:Lipase n=1 Tax=Phaseolus angularis TaxID=3914 RepID=A0A8T0K7X6_PHAAN|nr:Triacylglycerol lipase [Vigna angularis]